MPRHTAREVARHSLAVHRLAHRYSEVWPDSAIGRRRMAVLMILERHPDSGHEFLHPELIEAGGCTIAPNVTYSVIEHLYAEGLVENGPREPCGYRNRTRKTYRLTELGHQALEQLRATGRIEGGTT